MPKMGFLPMSLRMLPTWVTSGSGSPGPLERKMPSGLRASTSSALVSDGTTVTRHLAAQGSQEVARAASGVAGAQHSRAVLFQNVLAHGLGGMEDGTMSHGATEGGP